MTSNPPPQRALVPGAALVAASGAFVAWRATLWSRGFLHDDAFITLRYAQNWLAGNGIGWNPGDRVEGYTNFLQLLIATGLGALGVDLVDALRVIGVASWTGAVLALAVASRRAGLGGGGAWLLPAVVTAASVPGIVWVFGGLEAPLVALTVTVAGLAAHAAIEARACGARERVLLLLAGAGFGLALLARLDTGIFPAAVAVALVASRPPGRRLRVLVMLAGPLLVLVVPWLVWKLAYYGHVLPNTWWVKGSDPSTWRLAAGARYVGSFVLAPPFTLVWLVLGVARAWRAGRLGWGDGCIASAVGLHLAWVVYVGGDQMPAWRLLVPVVPLASWLAFRLWWPPPGSLGPGLATALGAGVAGLLALQLVWPGVAGPERNATAFVGAAVGDYIRESWRPGALVALNTAGSTPYHAPGLRYVDMLGLNDAHIARRASPGLRVPGQRLPGHSKGDGAYVLDQQPDYIILGPASGVEASQPWFLSDLEIREDPRFAERYVLRRARVDVRDREGFREHDQTRAGAFVFTWYERRR